MTTSKMLREVEWLIHIQKMIPDQIEEVLEKLKNVLQNELEEFAKLEPFTRRNYNG